MPFSASTHSPESSATAGLPVCATTARAFSRALSVNVAPVSATSGMSGYSLRPATLTSTWLASRMRRSSASFLALRVARMRLAPVMSPARRAAAGPARRSRPRRGSAAHQAARGRTAPARRCPGPRRSRRARATVGLEHVTVDDDGVLAERLGVHAGPQRPADQAGDLLGAAAQAAFDRLPVAAGVGGPGQHGVLRRHPAQPAAAPPPRHLLGGTGGAQHPGGTELDEHRAFRVLQPATRDLYLAQLIGAAPIGSGHGRKPSADRMVLRAGSGAS